MARREFSKEQKIQIVKEVMQTGNISVVARRYDIRNSVIGRWLDKYRQYGEAAFGAMKPAAKSVNPFAAQMHALEMENERLKRILGEKDLELAVMKDLQKKIDQRLQKS
jgi:transposase-like protein